MKGWIYWLKTTPGFNLDTSLLGGIPRQALIAYNPALKFSINKTGNLQFVRKNACPVSSF